MNIIAVILSLLALQGFSEGKETRLLIKIVPINSPNDSIKISLAEDVLTTTKGNNEAVIVRLKPVESKALWAKIEKIEKDNWTGFWASMDYLDGYLMNTSLKNKKDFYTFKGWNGCPPGFANILEAVKEHTEAKLISNNWKDMEASAKRYESFDDFQKLMSKAAEIK